jgi:hypothetical protein
MTFRIGFAGFAPLRPSRSWAKSISPHEVGYPRHVILGRDNLQLREDSSRKIPWRCQRLVVGTGRYGSLPVMDELKLEARRLKVDLVILPMDEAIETFADNSRAERSRS